MPNRITGLASGVDIDELVKSELSAYKSKITTQQQKKDTLLIQQEMYRDVINQGSDFYDKYLDISKTGDNLLSSSAFATTVFTSTNENAVTAKAVSGSAIKDNYKVKVNQLAQPASKVLKISDLEGAADNKISVKVGDKEVTIDLSSIVNSGKSDADKNKDLVSALNNNLSSLGLKAVYSEVSGGVILKTENTGKEQSFTIKDSANNINIQANGVDCEYTISSSTSGGERTFTSANNSVTLDGINFTFTSETTEAVTISGKTDVSSTVDKIKDFFNDFNTLITNLQTMLTEKHDRNYAPLTEDQKSQMKDSEITKWEEKVRQGQLHNDSLISNFVNNLKSAITSNTAELKKIGITTKKEYGVKAGTVEIDEEKLRKALETDPEGVMKLFTAAEESKVNAEGKSEKVSGTGGVFTRIKNTLYDNAKSTTKSAIIKKAGTATNNSNSTITKQINSYAKTISEMQTILKRKEQKLYSKYARLETAMNRYNNQLSNLQSYFS